MFKIFPGFPRGISAVVLPFDEVLELATVVSTVKDFVDFPFFLTFNLDGFGLRRWFDACFMSGAKAINVEDWIDLHEQWKFKTVVQITDAFKNFERAKLSWA